MLVALVYVALWPARRWFGRSEYLDWQLPDVKDPSLDAMRAEIAERIDGLVAELDATAPSPIATTDKDSRT